MEQRLKASITADTAGFVSAINAATKSVGNATDNWATRIAAAQNSFTTASVAAAELKNRIDEAAKAGQINPSESGQLANQMNQAAQAAQQAVNQMNDAINEIANGASALGTTVEQFQELQIAANDAGITMDDVSSAFDAMDNVMREAANTSSEASERLKKLGVSMQQLQSLSPADRMLALQDAINKEKDATARAINASIVFGNSYQNNRQAGTDIWKVRTGCPCAWCNRHEAPDRRTRQSTMSGTDIIPDRRLRPSRCDAG